MDRRFLESQNFTPDLIEDLTLTEEAEHLSILHWSRNSRRPKVVTTNSSLGILDCLPPEVFYPIIENLDLRTYSRLARVSRKGREVVYGLPQFVDIILHAPEFLFTLRNAQLTGWFPAKKILDSLYSKRCVYCHEFGGYIYTSTCERVCMECYDGAWELRVTPVEFAEIAFGITEKDIKGFNLPILHHASPDHESCSDASCFMSVMHAKETSMRVHGSYRAMRANVSGGGLQQLPVNAFNDIHHMQQAIAAPPPADPNTPRPFTPAKAPQMGLIGLTRFPYVVERDQRDWGRRCYGCRVVQKLDQQHHLPPEVRGELVNRSHQPDRRINLNVRKLRDEEAFLAHVKQCYGVQQLILYWQRHGRGRPVSPPPEETRDGFMQFPGFAM